MVCFKDTAVCAFGTSYLDGGDTFDSVSAACGVLSCIHLFVGNVFRVDVCWLHIF